MKKLMKVMFSIIAIMMICVPMVQAYSAWDWIWRYTHRDPLYYKNYSDYTTSVGLAESRWNAAIDAVTFDAGTGLQARVWVHDVSDQWTRNAAWTTPTTTTGDYFDYVDIYLNTYIMDPLSSSWESKIVTHEFGHALGLGHSDEYAVMRQGTSTPVSPQTDDEDGIEYIYQ